MAKAAGISVNAVQLTWRALGHQPHQVRQFKGPTDTKPAAKLHEIVGAEFSRMPRRRRNWLACAEGKQMRNTVTLTKATYDIADIHLYTRLHRRPPAETDIQEYFRVSPPSVHQMVLTLERAGLITRQPRTPRSIEVLVDSKLLPELI